MQFDYSRFPDLFKNVDIDVIETSRRNGLGHDQGSFEVIVEAGMRSTMPCA